MIKPKEETCTIHNKSECQSVMLPVKDALELLSGKWKIQVIISLVFGPKRFKEISTEIDGITDRMLSKELKELEQNQLIKRTIYETFPPKVEYALTEHGKSLRIIIDALKDWGTNHRTKIKSMMD